MKHGAILRLALVAVCVGFFSGPAFVEAAEAVLTPTKIESIPRTVKVRRATPDWILLMTDTQDVSYLMSPKKVTTDGKEMTTWVLNDTDKRGPKYLKEFKKHIVKEPAKYNSKYPLRGVVELGDKKYVFVADAAPDAKGRGYGLLYFDINGNGDLTDDGTLQVEEEGVLQARAAAAAKAKKAKEKTGKTAKANDSKKPVRRPVLSSLTYMRYYFPPIDMKINVDGKPVDYRFFFRTYASFRKDSMYLAAWLSPGVYYTGQIDLAGRKQRIAVVDFNGNGRFDDPIEIIESKVAGKGPKRFYPKRGDMVYLDPPQSIKNTRLIWDVMGLDCRRNVSPQICLDDQYFDLDVAQSGNELKVAIDPVQLPQGYIKNPNAKYSAVLYNDAFGLLEIAGTADRPVAVPEGKWTMVGCKVDLTDTPEGKEIAKKAAKRERAKVEKEKNLKKKALLSKLMKSKTYETEVGAVGTTNGKPVTVVKDQTVLLPFGPPYTTSVEVPYFIRRSETFYVVMNIFGSGGEAVTSMKIGGDNPPKPTFTITEPDGKVAIQGNFAYG